MRPRCTKTDKEIDKAIAVLKKVLKIKPSLIELKVRLGDLYLKQDKVSLSQELYEECLKTFQEMGVKQDALSVFKKIVELQPRNLILHRKLADMYEKENMPVQAATEFKSLLKKAKEIGLNTEILILLQKIVTLDPKSYEEALELVQIYYKTEQFDQACSGSGN